MTNEESSRAPARANARNVEYVSKPGREPECMKSGRNVSQFGETMDHNLVKGCKERREWDADRVKNNSLNYPA